MRALPAHGAQGPEEGFRATFPITCRSGSLHVGRRGRVSSQGRARRGGCCILGNWNWWTVLVVILQGFSSIGHRFDAAAFEPTGVDPGSTASWRCRLRRDLRLRAVLGGQTADGEDVGECDRGPWGLR